MPGDPVPKTMPALVDFQFQLLPRSFFVALAKAVRRGEEGVVTAERIAAEAQVELPPADVAVLLARWLSEVERYGVQHVVAHAALPESAAEVAAAVSLTTGRASGLGALDPTAPGAPERAAALLEEGHHRGVLLYPGLHGYALDDPRLVPVLHILAAARAPAVVHCGLAGVPLAARFGLPRSRGAQVTNPLDLVGPALAHPDVNFVIPEIGGGLLRETLLAGSECPNIHVATGDLARWLAVEPSRPSIADVFARLVAVFGPRRILFGTGSSTFPRGWRHDIFVSQREAIGACGLKATDRDHILGNNALALLRLPPPR